MNSDEIEKTVFDNILNKGFDEKMFLKYLAFVLALRDAYQSFHWGTSGSDFFEDHLLFERLYQKMSEEADSVAEKFVGLCSPGVVCPVKLSAQCCAVYREIMKDFEISEGGDALILRALYFEDSFLKISETMYSKLEDSGKLTLGLDDMMTGIYSSHEENIYLLKQKVISSSVNYGVSKEDENSEESYDESDYEDYEDVSEDAETTSED